MSVIDFIQKYILFLVPGIIGILFYNKLNVHKEQHYYLEFLKVILYSFISFIITDLILWIIKLIIPCFALGPLDIVVYMGSQEKTISAAHLIITSILSLIFACILTKINSNNMIFKIANRLNLTLRVDNETVWEHFFDDESFVVLRDNLSGNTFCGQVEIYSDNSDNREIVLKNVSVFDEASNFLYEVQRFYISRAHNEFTVEIPKKDKEQ